jgi:hypothetical protein
LGGSARDADEDDEEDDEDDEVEQEGLNPISSFTRTA